ncbi:SMI1/KNR4 family protein [Saccharibacillus sp. CPCC 101409]|uniref:SMI1/KNR4 family protein n=1 Tax=Saccharibacillus sp. CPCC 101409 TaxID=3058041 RepID=UPI00267121CB|nr:SMI1/KNR4 family protein [Saccharibacillus sp. CPCC 101409]MDO3411874.1 SMI1/KNR4 family protein [Saccharibacillus sp. CPCC 101409]
MFEKRANEARESLSRRLDVFPGSRRREKDKVEPPWIAEAERELGYRLPDSYVWWLKEFGALRLYGSEVYTLAPPEYRELASDDLLYNHRLNLEDDWRPEGRLYLFVPDTDEEFFFDVSEPVREPDAPAEYPVMRFDHLGGDAEVYADDFAGFLDRILTENNA